MDYSNKWNAIYNELESNLDKELFQLIFSNSKCLFLTKQQITIFVDDISILFVKEDSNNYLTIQNIIQTFLQNPGLYIEFVNSDNQKQNIQSELKTLHITQTLPEESMNNVKEIPKISNNLRNNLTFDNYFYSFENKKIIKACDLLINSIDAPEFNPFFIYGASGIGKTHLVNALGNELQKKYSDLKIHYATSTEFLEEYTNLFKGGLNNLDATDNFKDKYYDLDVFILDDIQLLEAKESTLNEFFSIFEKLRVNNKLVIITSDKHPQKIYFEERLITRFTSGLTLEIAIPNSDTKKQIFSYYAHKKELNIEESAVQIFIDNSSNIRTLLGYLNAITLYSINENYDDYLFTKEHALDLINTSTGNVNNLTAEQIMTIICQYFDLEKDSLLSKTKKAKIVNARRFAAYFMHKKLKISYKKIALYLGQKEHTSAMRAVNEISNKKSADKYRNDYDQLSKIINR